MSRAKSIFTYGIAGIILTVFWWMMCGLCNVKAASYVDEFEISIQAVEKYDMANELLEYINQERQNLGLRSLTMDRELLKAALIRATEVNVLNSHWRPNGTRATSAMGVEAVYENINSYAVSGKNIFEGWMASTEGHRTPITDPSCKAIGIGIVNHAVVAEFSYSEPDEIKVSGINTRMRSVQFRLGFCSFTTEKGTSLEYSSQENLMLVSTIENQGIPIEVDPAQFQISSSDSNVIAVAAGGTLHGKGAGTAEVKVIWKEDTGISSSIIFIVKPLDIGVQGNAGFSYEQNQVYSGSAITPKVTVADKDGKVLEENIDYTVTYSDNVDSGAAMIAVEGRGNYCGTRYLSFTIQEISAPKDTEVAETEVQVEATEDIFLANFNYIIPTVTLSQNSYAYDGSAKTPSVNVRVKGEQLQEGIDFEIGYENNVDPGQATVIVKGINRCSGIYRVSFTINRQVQQENEKNSGSVSEPLQSSTAVSAAAAAKADSSSSVAVSTKNVVTVTYSKADTDSQTSVAKKSSTVKKVKKITVKQPKIQKIKRTKKKQITVYWKKDKTVSGYQVQIATNKKMPKGKKTVKVSKDKTSCTIKKLKSKRTYYVRIRSYKKVDGKIYYSKWSAVKKVKVK